jgi:hypothetical protein
MHEHLPVPRPPHTQQISVLDSVPDLDLLTYLPQLLDGLMNLLSDPNREIRVAAHKCMMEFLVEIQVLCACARVLVGPEHTHARTHARTHASPKGMSTHKPHLLAPHPRLLRLCATTRRPRPRSTRSRWRPSWWARPPARTSSRA